MTSTRLVQSTNYDTQAWKFYNATSGLDQYFNATIEKNLTTNGNQFLKGMQANNYGSNTTNCYNRLLYFYFHSIPLMRWRYIYGTVDDSIYNTTLQIANLTNAAMICYDATENWWFWGKNKISEFGSFTLILMGFFQNLLGNVVALTNIYKAITTASTTGDTAAIWYQSGRIVNLLIDFEPVDVSLMSQPFSQQYSDDNKYADIFSQYLDEDYENDSEETVRTVQSSSSPMRQIVTANLTSEAGYKSVLSFDGMINFMVGMINGTKTPSTQNMTVCQKKVITKWGNNAKLVANYTKDGNLWKAGWVMWDMIYNIDSITNSCLRGFEECGLGLVAYGEKLAPSTVINNVVFNFGDIFDAIRDVVLFLKDDSRGEYNIPYDAGYGLGYAIYLVLDPN